MKEEKMLENATMIGETILGPGLAELAKKHKVIGDIRGAGVFWGVDLVSDRATHEPLAPYGASSLAMNELVAACKKNGLMPFNNFNRVHLCPPCNISVEDAKLGLEILDKALAEIGKYYTGV
jgi:taurine--2-oxoglutarate transaminase